MNRLSLRIKIITIKRPICGLIREFDLSLLDTYNHEKRPYKWVRRHGRAVLELRYSLSPVAFYDFLKDNPEYEMIIIEPSWRNNLVGAKGPTVYSVSPLEKCGKVPSWYFLPYPEILKLLGLNDTNTINIKEQHLDTMSMLLLSLNP